MLADSEVIISATANQAINVEDLENARDGILLVSGGSKANEFDIAGIKSKAVSSSKLSPHLERFVMPWGRAVVVANDGKAVNFLKGGSPEEVMDVVFAEQVGCLDHFWLSNNSKGVVDELPAGKRDEIASKWNEMQGRWPFGMD